MMLLLALFGLAFADNKDYQCLLDVVNGVPGKTMDSCKVDERLEALQTESRSCANALGKCGEFGGGGGGGAAEAMGFVVKYGDKQFGMALTQKFPLGAAYDELHKRALAKLEMDDDHDLTFDYANANPKVSGKVSNDEELEAAIRASIALDFVLVLTAHKTTIAPTPEPTEPWGTIRYIKQVWANVADGRDSGPATGRSFKFQKTAKETLMRLHYEDNLRAHNNGAVCYWEIYVDGKRCPSGWIRGAMHSQGNNNNDHQTATVVGLCQPAVAGNQGEHTMSIQVSGNGRDCYTGWDPESKGTFLMEAKEVRDNFYGYTGKTSRGDVRGEDNMFPITNRILNFKKKEKDTTIRILYADNFRVYNGGHCRWYIRVDRKICEGNKYIAASIHTHSGENDHVPQAIAGYCNGLAVGDHKFEVGVQSGGHDCYTGWENSWHLETQEVMLGDDARRFMFMRTGNNVDGRDNGYVNWRVLTFKKAAASTIMRLFYYDNLRVHGDGKWCKWVVRVDDKETTPRIQGNRYVVSNQNDHTPGVIVGYAKGIAAGTHTMKIHVHGNSADCYTGWDRQSQGNFLLEAEELDAGAVSGSIGA